MRFSALHRTTRIKAMSIPLVAAALVAFAVATSAAKAANARDARAAGVVASFGYGLSQLSTDNSGAVIETNFDHVGESSTSPVQLNACSSSAPGGIASYQWSFDHGASTVSTSNCITTWQRPVSHATTSRDASLTVVPANSALATATITKTIAFSDVVVASLGDSAASGEGAPEHLYQTPAFVASAECDRSGWAASAQAALTLQQQLPNTSVHFWHLACSGATISSADSQIWAKLGDMPSDSGGLITSYKGSHHSASLPPQVDRMATLEQQSGLPVDRLLITAGVNELHWSTIAKHCSGAGFLGAQSAQLKCLKSTQPLLDKAVATLPAHFDALAARLPASLVAPGNVYLTEYFDPFDSLGGPQSPLCGGDYAATWTLRTYGISAVENPIQTIVHDEAAAHGWNFIGGIRSAFQGHGVCWIDAAKRWVNPHPQPLLPSPQGDDSGTWHANRAGQTALAPILFNAIKPGLVNPPTPTPVPSVIGLTPAAAVGILRAAGFWGNETDMVDNNCENIGVVRGQSPHAGTAALPGSTVVFFVGKRPPHPCP
jgi:hypothetical protein